MSIFFEKIPIKLQLLIFQQRTKSKNMPKKKKKAQNIGANLKL